MYEPAGTVDHFVSWHEDRSKAYEWGNYRFSAAWINASKSRTPVADILDPFNIEDGRFELLLPSLQLRVFGRRSRRTAGTCRTHASGAAPQQEPAKFRRPENAT